MEFPTTDKQIKMWCFAYADEQRDFSATMDIDGADRVERAKRLYDFISSYQPSAPSNDRVLFERLVFALIPRTDYNPCGAAQDFFKEITGRWYAPSEVYHQDVHTSQREQTDKQEEQRT